MMPRYAKMHVKQITLDAINITIIISNGQYLFQSTNSLFCRPKLAWYKIIILALFSMPPCVYTVSNAEICYISVVAQSGKPEFFTYRVGVQRES